MCIMASSEDLDELMHNASFHQGLHCCFNMFWKLNHVTLEKNIRSTIPSILSQTSRKNPLVHNRLIFKGPFIAIITYKIAQDFDLGLLSCVSICFRLFAMFWLFKGSFFFGGALLLSAPCCLFSVLGPTLVSALFVDASFC